MPNGTAARATARRGRARTCPARHRWDSDIGAGNVISGNAMGIDVFGATGTENMIQGNTIGIDSTGR